MSKSIITRRRIWQLTLLLLILVLLFFIILILYNEIVNERKLKDFLVEYNETENLISKLDSVSIDYLEKQEAFYQDLSLDNKLVKERYFNSLKQVESIIDDIELKDKDTFLTALPKSDDVPAPDKDLSTRMKTLIDSISQNSFQEINKSDLLSTHDDKRLVFDDLKMNVSVETKKEVDSVKKKGLFGRLGDAISGEVGVQKEKTEVTMILEYDNRITKGSIDEQMAKVVDKVSEFYEKKYNLLKNNYQLLLRNKDVAFKKNLDIQVLTNDVIDHYKAYLAEKKNLISDKYSAQYSTNRAIRLYAMLGIAGLLVLLTAAVLRLTRKNHQYEKELLVTKEKLEDNLQLKNKMVSMISHDIRSPLNIILLYLKQLFKLEKDEKRIKVFESINYITSSALNLSNTILDFSKNEDIHSKLRKDVFNLHDEINQILDAFSKLAQEKGNILLNNNKVEPDAKVVFDRVKLQRLYLNILDNAIKFTDNGKIIVLSSWEHRTHDMYLFTLKITDTGKGIPKEMLENVFEPFVQAKQNNIDPQQMGVGLGLYFCKEIAEMYDGNISITSDEGNGTEIVTSLYIKRKE